MGIFVILTLFYLVHRPTSADYIIHTPSGSVRGMLNHFGSHDVFQFRNIPYAKPPLGDLRFHKPQPYGAWTGVREGTHFGPSCMQDVRIMKSYKLENENISEDCLSLNIYLPYKMPQRGQNNKSVMIWVHGGGYMFGQGQFYDPSALAITGDVVVVTINYRLGVFGFLSTDDGASVGNYGLWDQHLAFIWVKNNIASVGGNPNSITIFGESAGGLSVGLQSLAVQNKGLFQRAIAQSGVGNSLATVTYEGMHFARKFGVLVDCMNSTLGPLDTTGLVSCMRQKSSNELLLAQLNMSDSFANSDRYRIVPVMAPVVDGEFVMDSPKTILKKRNSESFRMFQSIDFMAGNCHDEGSLVLAPLVKKSRASHFNISIGVPTSILCDYIVPGIIKELQLNITQSSAVSNAVCNFYKSSDLAEQGRKITELVGDLGFVVPAVESLNAHSVSNNVTRSYQYMFNRPALFSVNDLSWFSGSPHAAELPYLFELNISVPPSEQALSQAMLKYWTNFAKTGDPNVDSLRHWPTYNKTERSYLNLDSLIASKNHVFNDRVNFWTNSIPGIIKGISVLQTGLGK